jgi:hypothetical protein
MITISHHHKNPTSALDRNLNIQTLTQKIVQTHKRSSERTYFVGTCFFQGPHFNLMSGTKRVHLLLQIIIKRKKINGEKHSVIIQGGWEKQQKKTEF